MVLMSACRHHDGKVPIAQKDLSIRGDGTLNFVSSNGSVLASILIEIADTPEAQMKGLMGRNSLDHHHGMLFVFESIKERKFRMLNTRIPLDIIFVGKDECILNIFENTTPMSKQIYQSSGPIKYAVEVRANFTKSFKINESTCILWQRF
jgi:uncharacterized membrane protein (UPF0127 family)